MKTIGIELNHVIRNFNKQLLKYYAKDFNPSLDIDSIDDQEDVMKNYLTFENQEEKNNFIYVDYPFELFGCAKIMESNLNAHLTIWLQDVLNVEDDEFNIVFYSLNETGLSIQSTYFFLSRIGSQVRTMMFPRSIDDVWKVCDIVITANNKFFEKDAPEGKQRVLIKRKFNETLAEKANLAYDNLSDLLQDRDFFKKILGTHHD